MIHTKVDTDKPSESINIHNPKPFITNTKTITTQEVSKDQSMLLKKLTIDKIGSKLTNKRVLIRVDFNVPIKNGKITDDTRIRESLKTIKYALEKNAKCIVLMSHLGRPNGEKNSKYTLQPIAPALSILLNKDVEFISDCIGEQVLDVFYLYKIRKLTLQVEGRYSYLKI